MGKEVQRESLLITSGCSFSDPRYGGYLKNDITIWCDTVAKELNIDVLNLGKHAFSNDYIENSIMDAVIDNQDKDLIVMFLWTSPNRLNFFDHDRFVISEESYWPSSKDPEYHLLQYRKKSMRPWWGFEFDKRAVNYNLRCIWRLNEFLKNRNIEYYQAHSSSLINNIVYCNPPKLEDKMLEEDRIKTLIDNVPQNRYYDKNFFTTQSFRSNAKWSVDETMQISKEDIHPNQEGHNYIADQFLLMKESQKISSDDYYENSNYRRPEFIYD